MPAFLKDLTPKTWFSLALVFLLFASVMVTQFATRNARDNSSKAAACGGGDQTKVTLRPNGNFQNGLFGQSPANGSHWDKVDEATSDGDGSFVWDDTIGSPGAGTSVILFTQPGFNFANKTIHSVTIAAITKEGVHSTAYGNFAVHNGSALRLSPGYGSDPDYALDEYTWTTSPFTGAGWTGSEVSSLKIGTNSYRSAQANPLTVTQLWMEVCYTNNPPPAPTLNFSAQSTNIAYNTSTTLNWNSSNTTSCNASGAWANGKPLSGSQGTGNLTSSATYNLSCTGAGGSVSRSVTVNVGSPPQNPQPQPQPQPPVGGCIAFCTPPPPPPPPLVPNPVNPSGPRLSTSPVTTSNGDITLTFPAHPYLQGGMETQITIDGTGVSQKVVVEKAGGSMVVKPGSLSKGTTYKLKVSSKNSLVTASNFVYGDGTKITLPMLVVGDFNSDNTINQADLDKLKSSGFKSQESLYDVNYDSRVNSIDYSLLLLNLGKTGN